MSKDAYSRFYDQDRDAHYKPGITLSEASKHYGYALVQQFVDDHDLHDSKCLEIGSGRGFFQDIVEDYTGTDISEALAKLYHKPYAVAQGTRYPFPDKCFDAIWTVGTYEHIPLLQEAMLEIKRLVRPGGLVLFAPAWQCRSWAAEGYPVRSYSDLDLRGKLIKASVPIRDTVIWRSLSLFPKRIARLISYLSGKRYTEIRYTKLRPSYEKQWMSDSDACNHIDPHDAILWFQSHGFSCENYATILSAMLVRTGPLIFKAGTEDS